MILKEILLCFVLLLGSSLCIPIDQPQVGEPLDLSFTCIKVLTTNEDKKKDLTPVLLIHGLSSFKESWQGHDMIISLKTGRRVCVADLRNHGDSPWSDISDIDSMTSDLNPLLKAMKTDKVILLGHSLGGKISIHFTLKNPEKVEKLIVEDMRPNGVTEEASNEILLFIKILHDSLSILPKETEEKEAKLAIFKHIQEVLDKANTTFKLDESFLNLLPIKCSKGKCELKMNIEVFKKYLETDDSYLTLSTGLFEKPALFIYGSISPFKVGEDKAEILKLFPKAKLVPIEGAGHMVHEKPQFVDEVIKFINSEL